MMIEKLKKFYRNYPPIILGIIFIAGIYFGLLLAFGPQGWLSVVERFQSVFAGVLGIVAAVIGGFFIVTTSNNQLNEIQRGRQLIARSQYLNELKSVWGCANRCRKIWDACRACQAVIDNYSVPEFGEELFDAIHRGFGRLPMEQLKVMQANFEFFEANRKDSPDKLKESADKYLFRAEELMRWAEFHINAEDGVFQFTEDHRISNLLDRIKEEKGAT